MTRQPPAREAVSVRPVRDAIRDLGLALVLTVCVAATGLLWAPLFSATGQLPPSFMPVVEIGLNVVALAWGLALIGLKLLVGWLMVRVVIAVDEAGRRSRRHAV